MALLKIGLGSTRTEFMLEEHMILEALRLRFGRGTPGAALRVTELFGRRACSLWASLAERPAFKIALPWGAVRVRSLIAHGVDPNCCAGMMGVRAEYYARKSGNARFLSSSGIMRTSPGQAPLNYSVVLSTPSICTHLRRYRHPLWRPFSVSDP